LLLYEVEQNGGLTGGAHTGEIWTATELFSVKQSGFGIYTGNFFYLREHESKGHGPVSVFLWITKCDGAIRFILKFS